LPQDGGAGHQAGAEPTAEHLLRLDQVLHFRDNCE
jgi:hypothetical protein